MSTTGSVNYIIVNRGKGDRLLRRAHQIGAHRATVFFGEGTLPSRWQEMLGINQTQKEVLMIALPDEAQDSFYSLLREEFHLHKRYSGIAFSVPYRQYTADKERSSAAQQPASVNPSHICLMTIVDKGLGESCMRLAREAGAQGGTIVHAHGAGVPQDFVFPIAIHPQKDMVMIIVRREIAPQVRIAIYDGLSLEHKGAGIIFALPVTRTLGLYEDSRRERGNGK